MTAGPSAGGSPPLRVVIAEDSVLLREGLARLITDSGGEVVAKVGDGPSLVAAVEEHRPDVSVVDVRIGATEKHITNIFGKLELPDSDHDHRRVLAVLAYLES